MTRSAALVDRSPDFPIRAEQLVREAQNGSNEAFEELCRVYRNRLLRKLATITKQREDAEDALQNAYMRAYTALHTFEGRSSFGSWMTRIAINCALQGLRKRRTHRELLILDEQEVGENLFCDPLDPAPNPEEACARKEIEARMRYTISRLPERLRVSLELQIDHDISAREIALRLGITESAAKTRIMRAKSKVRRHALESKACLPCAAQPGMRGRYRTAL